MNTPNRTGSRTPSLQYCLALFTASALTALPVLIFNGHGWYPVVNFYKWVFTFTIAAYGSGMAAFLFLGERAGVRVTRIELFWLLLVLLALSQPFFIPVRSFHEWLRNVYFFAALGGAVFVLRNLPIESAMDGILRTAAVTGGISTLLGFAQNLAPRLNFKLKLPFILDTSGAPDRFLANTSLDNILGGYLALAVVAGAWLLIHARRSGARPPFFVRAADFFLLVLNCVGMWRTGTRSAFIACALGLLTLLAASGFLRKSLKILAAAILLLAVLALAAPGVFQVERRDMSELFSPDTLSVNREGRWSIWLTSWEMIKSAPLLGVGLGNYKWNYLDALAASRESWPVRPRYTFWAHNEYLQWAAEIGVPGAVLFFSLLLCCAALCLRGIKGEAEKKPFLSWSLAALTVLMADSCFSRPMHHVDTAFTLSLALAVISRLSPAPEAKLSLWARRGVGGAILALALSGVVFLAQSFQGQEYLGKYFYNPLYISLVSSEEREQSSYPLFLQDACLQLTARENYRRTLLGFGDAEQNDRDAIRVLARYFETQPRYEELNLLMLLYQKRGEFDEGRRYFKYYPSEEREKFLRGEFDGKYMLD